MNYKKKKIILLSLMVLFSFFFSNKFLTKISLADFTTSVGTKWTYERSFFTTTAGRFGIEITNITQATGPILGTIYELGYAPQTDKQIDGYYIFNETTINNLILSNPTEERTYGGVLCNCVLWSVELTDMVAIIDTSTGIILETINNTLGEDWFLVTWSIELEPQWLVDIGDEWTYENKVDTISQGYIGIEVTNFTTPTNNIRGTIYYEGMIPSEYQDISDNVIDNSTIQNYISMYGTDTGDYGGTACEFVEFSDSLNNTMRYDIDTGILLEMNSTLGESIIQKILINWSVLIKPIAEWLVIEGDNWTYELYRNDSKYTSLGLLVSSVLPYPSLVRGTQYAPGIPPMVNRDLYMYVYDNLTISHQKILNGSKFGTFGDLSREYVMLDKGMSGTVKIDVETGIVLERNQTQSMNTVIRATLTNWTSIEIPQYGEWFADVGDEWTYESFIDGTPNNKQGFNITKLNDWPSYPNADYYSNYIYSYNHLIDISLLVDNNSISYFLSIGPTEVRKYGGEPCNCVIVKNYMLADQLIYDIDKGILLESDFNDAGTLRNFTLISWSVLLPGPDITINSPNENDLFNLTPPNYIVAINDPNLNYTWYTLNEGDPIYFLGVNGTNIGTIDPTSWSILDDGSVTIRFSANNSEGIIGYSEITVIKDVSSPVVSIHLPENLDEFGRDPPSYEINITEVNLEYAWYTLNNSDPIFFSGSNGLNSGIINLDIWNEFGNGPILITFYVNDTTGIVIFDFVIIEKYVKPKSNGIPGYDLFLLFGSLTIIICLLLRNFRKKTNF